MERRKVQPHKHFLFPPHLTHTSDLKAGSLAVTLRGQSEGGENKYKFLSRYKMIFFFFFFTGRMFAHICKTLFRFPTQYLFLFFFSSVCRRFWGDLLGFVQCKCAFTGITATFTGRRHMILFCKRTIQMAFIWNTQKRTKCLLFITVANYFLWR